MSRPTPDMDLLAAVMLDNLNFHAARAALRAGANVNGRPGRLMAPMTAAAAFDHPDMVHFLLGHGADPEKPVVEELPCSGKDEAIAIPGERALHIAARGGFIEVVGLLLNEGGGADPNATGNIGRTPLMATCGSIHANVKIVRLLLEAGADPTGAQGDGYTPLHAVAFGGRMELVDMLYTAAPANLSRCALNDATPLYVACTRGHEGVVSRLLSLGAIQPDDSDLCLLATAAHNGYVGIVRVLISEGGMRAVGGKAALAGALLMVARSCRARILRLLLTGGEEQRRSEWANSSFCDGRLLHFAADCCNPAAVSILLEAGADEAARDSEGRLPRDIDEVEFGQDIEVEMDRGGKVAIYRMLQRGPAYRARSWAWPSDEEAGAGSSGDGDTAAAAAAASAAVLSSRSAVKTPPVVGVRIFRPKEGSK